jgi:hypothetical protein
MPKTPPTIVAPLPHDPRVMMLAKSVGVTRREAYAAASESWAWMAVQAVDDIVPQTEPDALDSVVDIAGFGQAMLQARLVGVVDDGLVLPAELRHQQRDERGSGRAKSAADGADAGERKKAGDRRRQRDKYWRDKLTKPASKNTNVTLAEDKGMKRKPARIGTVDNFPVMLLWSRAGVPFYKLAGASPKEWTGTVTEPENPSYGDALVALHAAMKREDGKGLGGGDSFRPSLKAVLAEAERYQAELAAAAVDDARRAEANRAAAEAAAEDHDNIYHEAAERETSRQPHAPQREGVRPHASLTPAEGVSDAESPCRDGDLGASLTVEKPHASLTPPALSSSSSSSVSASSEQSCKEQTTTTKSVTDAERDHEDRILDRLVPRVDPQQAKQQERHQLRVVRIAEALDTTTDAVEYQWRNAPDVLFARCKLAGIDPKTGDIVNAKAPHEPAGARHDISVTTEPIAGHEPAAGSVDARGDVARREDEDPDRPRHGPWETMAALKRLGIQPPTLNVAPGRGHRLEDIDLEREDQTSLVTARDLA